MQNEINLDFMKLALVQAQTRRGFCAPNPAVGAVVVKEGGIIAKGLHWASGHPHAEVDALNKIGEQAQGATLYVTLEPCCHTGKTPPCTELIIDKGIKQVYYGLQDPNPKVAGRGAAAFRAAGIECHHLECDFINHFYQSYIYWWQHQRPWVNAKLAMSLDGKIAGAGGEPLRITGEECQRLTHQWRKRSDAILTTAKTIIKDDPQLNVRIDGEVIAKPVYVLDRLLRMPMDAKIFDTSANLTVLHGASVETNKRSQFQAKGVNCIAIDGNSDGLNLRSILEIIGQEGMHDLWVETGGRCFQSFFEQSLINRALIYIAPKQLGESAQSAFDHSFDVMNSNCQVEWQTLGNDMVCELIYSVSEKYLKP